jgi:hypothetical protein
MRIGAREAILVGFMRMVMLLENVLFEEDEVVVLFDEVY